MAYLRFGTFIPPIHPVGENPTLCIDRDMQLIEHLDRLGYDEAWVGEHHSAGTEVIASPELIIAAVAERTKRIRLGTGVSSLPYHHPLILADRIMQLHHMTRGRAMFGAGPGALVSDAMMLGLIPERQRDMMEEALECILRLFRGETVTHKSDWFELKDAHLQLRPYGGEPIEVCTACVVSPSGPRAAGRLGTGLLSIGATAPESLAAAAKNWQVAVDMAARHGHTMNREQWRMVGLVHVAETREQAFEDVKFGLPAWVQYFEDVATLPMVPPDRKGEPAEFLTSIGRAVIGTPDDCIRQIEKLEQASGGFGCFLITDHNWAPFAAKLRSYEMVARYVFPRFQGLNTQRHHSYQWVRRSHDAFVVQARRAQQQMIELHQAEEATRAKGKTAAE
ncbi:MAG: LLM class flavin-dependent oxidoreductase [Alphaproteobacteria bacterium]|nr:LLM class flavin-dependent oxidoreductase [Alphaproteobacteria bacterium]